MSEEKQNKIEDELAKIKEEMQDLKSLLQQKRETEYEDDLEERSHERGQKFKFQLDPEFERKLENLDFDLDGVDATLNNYISTVMKGVSENIKMSLNKASTGIRRIEHDIARNAHRAAERELKRTKREMKRSMKDYRRRARHGADNHDRIIHLEILTDEELEEFYEMGTKLVSALSDPRRIQLLKILESGPAYQQGDLAEKTNIKGGTFKHHMDILIEAKYVYQEATRGRYLITQLGVEALKLAEILYRRYKFEIKQDQMNDEKLPDTESTDESVIDQVNDLQENNDEEGSDEESEYSINDVESEQNMEE